GNRLGIIRYVDVPSNYYAQVSLEEVVLDLPPGAHTVAIEALTKYPLRIDTGTLEILELHPIPNVGPGADVFTAPVPQSSVMMPTDSAWHEVGISKTFTSDGSPLRIGGLLQVTNFHTTDAVSDYRL